MSKSITEKRNEVRKYLSAQSNMTEDRYGNFKLHGDAKRLRYKIKYRVLRLEAKSLDGTWYMLRSYGISPLVKVLGKVFDLPHCGEIEA